MPLFGHMIMISLKVMKMADDKFLKKFKVNKPEFIKHYEISEPMVTTTQFSSIYEKRIATVVLEDFENIILEKIVEIGKEARITDLFLFNKNAITDVLLKAHPKEVWFHNCPTCGKPFLQKGSNYCPECGQRLDWGGSDG